MNAQKILINKKDDCINKNNIIWVNTNGWKKNTDEWINK